MKEIKLNKRIEEREKIEALLRSEEAKKHQDTMNEFRSSAAYGYIMDYFKRAEDRIIGELESMQHNDMKSVFMLPLKEQRAKVAEMSKRDAILTGVLSIIKQVKNRL